MEYTKLGRSGITVSKICLGTMTWGEQNSKEDGFAQMDYAIENGVNFFDTAEMYPIDTRAATYGHTEEIIGSWLKQRNNRSKVVIASKVCGPGRHHVRKGKCNFERKNIVAAINGSLKRLQTEYIDLYQLHWPDRNWVDFGNLGQSTFIPDNGADRSETLDTMDELIKEGKIRSWGLSNESAWGVMDFVGRAICRDNHQIRPVTVQNAYNLLNRKFEISLAEIAFREDVGLLAYAPVAAGVLTGKYLHGARPTDARMTIWPHQDRYFNPEAEVATESYMQLAKKYGVAPEILAHAFVISRPFVTASIVGGTKIEHLSQAFKALDYGISKELEQEFEKLHRKYLVPAP